LFIEGSRLRAIRRLSIVASGPEVFRQRIQRGFSSQNIQEYVGSKFASRVPGEALDKKTHDGDIEFCPISV
jgi:hypothetical protein